MYVVTVLVSAGNLVRLRAQFQALGPTANDVDDAIARSEYARDFALNRHDISNVSIDVDKGRFRRHEDDATSVHMLVRAYPAITPHEWNCCIARTISTLWLALYHMLRCMLYAL